MPSQPWLEIMSTALSMGDEFRSRGSVAWYRGERYAQWQLKSTIHRYAESRSEAFRLKIPPEDKKEWAGYLRDEYKKVYRDFKTEAWPLLAESERSDWGIVFAMQHFSLPTRLLDWTESFACAVFFAQLSRKPDDDASIWILDPCGLNELSVVKRYAHVALDESAEPTNVIDISLWHPRRLLTEEGLLDSIAVTPIYTNSRMVQQRARFTLMGDSVLPLDAQWAGELSLRGQLHKIILPPETFGDAEEFLMAAGINAFTFFPDLQGLAMKHQARMESDIRLAKKAYPRLFK
jgi:FRG domain